MTYAVARVCSWIFIPEAQMSLLNKHGVGGAALITTLGECAGNAGVFFLVSTAVAPLTQLRDYAAFRTISAAITSMPFVYAALLHLSGVQLFAPYLVAVGASRHLHFAMLARQHALWPTQQHTPSVHTFRTACDTLEHVEHMHPVRMHLTAGPRRPLPEHVRASAVLPAAASEESVPAIFGGVLTGQLASLLLLALANVHDLSDFTWTVLIPTVRIAATILVAYWIWQEHHVRALLPTVLLLAVADADS